MEILTEFDELQAALAKVNMDESVLPYVNGRLVPDSDAYNKTQKILNCPEMISAHKYLYELDMDQLSEEEIDKIDQLYALGCDRGFIIDDLTKWDDDEGGEDAETEEVAAVEKPVETRPQNTLFKAKVPCWTIIYSATKDGDIKTGEAYSNAVSMSAAKADVNAKLSRCGYDNISILAIENCDGGPVSASSFNKPFDMNEADDEEADNDEDGKEADDTKATDDSTDDEGSDDDSTEDEGGEDDAGNEDADDTGDDSDDSGDEEASNDEESDDSEDNSEDDEESDDDDDEGEELSSTDKANLRNEYRKTFKDTLVKCKFDTSFNDLTLEEKVKFFTELAKAWTKEEPSEFMTDKEIEQLNNVVAATGDEESDEEEDAEEPEKSDESNDEEESDEDEESDEESEDEESEEEESEDEESEESEEDEESDEDEE